jgi:peptide/nickel transport system ATP-binding protein
MTEAPLVTIRDLCVSFASGSGELAVLRDVNLDLPRGKIVGVVGESGSGKSTLAAAITRLLPANLARLSGRIDFAGRELVAAPDDVVAGLRGREIAMVFQDPMSALSPVFTIGTQLADFLRARHPDLPRTERLARASAMLRRVGIADAERRLLHYPHQLSGGQRQRVMIAAALLAEPLLLIADEPTTALDPTIEVQIVHLLADLRGEFGGTVLLISHSLGLISELCDQVVVLYAGSVMESGAAEAVLHDPRHPYTQALLACEVDAAVRRGDRLAAIPGEVPDLAALAEGCVFAPRCARAVPDCTRAVPAMRDVAGRQVACIRA